MNRRFGSEFRAAIDEAGIFPLIGVYDVFSATLAAQSFDGIFISGFGFAASYYGLPDIGFNAWSDVVAFVQRVRTVLPNQCIVVDIDDGFADIEVACHVVSLLESAGASGIIIEDQLRPRRCGHLAGKQIMPLDGFMQKLRRVLQARRDMFVVSRTDATDREDILQRVQAFSSTDADAILVDGIRDPSLLCAIRSATHKRLAFNQIAGGAAAVRDLRDLQDAGVSIAIFSTPCLFATQGAITAAMERLTTDHHLAVNGASVTLHDCNQVLESNLRRRDAVEEELASR
jgi:2-methylisocitrate lyase-like PEP mutase family enzyme